MNHSYKSSALLSKEKGAFPDFDRKKYLSGHFILKLEPAVRDLIFKYGIRNSHLLSIQPTGNSAVLANNVSGGLEPIFSAEYIRTSVQPTAPPMMSLPKNIDWNKKTFENSDKSNWQWIQEGDEDLLKSTSDGVSWKIDQQRGLLKETLVMDYAVRFHKENGSWDADADWASTAQNLSLDDHLNTMRIFSKYVDSAISKTVNLPEKFPYDKFKKLYFDMYSTGTIKGCTTYREGTMAAVLSTVQDKTQFDITKATPRPAKVKCDIFHVKSNNVLWIVIVGKVDDRPYEVFAMKQSSLHLPEEIKSGTLIKEKSGLYHLETVDGWILKDIRKFFESDEQEALTRMISTALRHGADIEFVVDQLLKSEGTINSFSKAIARTLKKYLKDLKIIHCAECESKNLKIDEGCFTCLDCGSSKCS
jgi:ribonucleoside-diphosphate reductase alpha chain